MREERICLGSACQFFAVAGESRTIFANARSLELNFSPERSAASVFMRKRIWFCSRANWMTPPEGPLPKRVEVLGNYLTEKLAGLFSTHPLDEQRIKAIKAEIEKIKAEEKSK